MAIPPSANLGASTGAYANALSLAQRLIGADQQACAGRKPQAGELIQGRYEPTAAFDARVAQAKLEYEEAVVKYNGNVAGYPQWRKNALLEEALSLVLNPLTISRTDYDPDREILARHRGDGRVGPGVRGAIHSHGENQHLGGRGIRGGTAQRRRREYRVH